MNSRRIAAERISWLWFFFAIGITPLVLHSLTTIGILPLAVGIFVHDPAAWPLVILFTCIWLVGGLYMLKCEDFARRGLRKLYPVQNGKRDVQIVIEDARITTTDRSGVDQGKTREFLLRQGSIVYRKMEDSFFSIVIKLEKDSRHPKGRAILYLFEDEMVAGDFAELSGFFRKYSGE